jgi:hypothetical protein
MTPQTSVNKNLSKSKNGCIFALPPFIHRAIILSFLSRHYHLVILSFPSTHTSTHAHTLSHYRPLSPSLCLHSGPPSFHTWSIRKRYFFFFIFFIFFLFPPFLSEGILIVIPLLRLQTAYCPFVPACRHAPFLRYSPCET